MIKYYYIIGDGMDDKDNKEIIQFGNSLNPNYDNNSKFNDLSKNQDMTNINNIKGNDFNNKSINSENIYVQDSQDKFINNKEEIYKNVHNNIVSINNQEVVKLDKEDDEFKVKKDEEKDNKKSSIITFLVIIVLILLIFGIIKIVNNFLSNNKIDNNNSLVFVSNAESFIMDAKTLVKKDEKSSKDLNFAPSCIDDNKKIIIISLSKILSNVNDNKISPFGGEYNLDKSYVRVNAIYKNELCEFEYYIYLTDNNYSIGTENNPIISDKITKEVVKKNSK